MIAMIIAMIAIVFATNFYQFLLSSTNFYHFTDVGQMVTDCNGFLHFTPPLFVFSKNRANSCSR